VNGVGKGSTVLAGLQQYVVSYLLTIVPSTDPETKTGNKGERKE
jgi:hypothetical protein